MYELFLSLSNVNYSVNGKERRYISVFEIRLEISILCTPMTEAQEIEVRPEIIEMHVKIP